jgi:hypothetical protein
MTDIRPWEGGDAADGRRLRPLVLGPCTTGKYEALKLEEERFRRDTVGYVGPAMYADLCSVSSGSLSVVEVDDVVDATEEVWFRRRESSLDKRLT